LPYFFTASEGDDLQRDGKVDVGFDHQGSENRTHLLEVEGNVATALVAGIGDD
jgi:hypothetical protein